MKKQKQGSELKKNIIYAPAFPYRGPKIFEDLRAALTASWGFQPGFSRLGRILGEKPNLTHYWFRVLPHRHVIGFLSLLERLPASARQAWLDQHCRELPHLDHPRIAHDPIAISNLEKLYNFNSQITWIHGGSEFQRTFVASALAHSFPRFCGGKSFVAGLDIHEPRKWVPVENVIYLEEPIVLGKIKQILLEAWPDVEASKAPLVLLNGVWQVIPELHEKILSLASKCHVLVTVPKLPEKLRAQVPGSTRIVTLGPASDAEKCIRLKVEVL